MTSPWALMRSSALLAQRLAIGLGQSFTKLARLCAAEAVLQGAHRQVLEAEVMEQRTLRPVHPVRQLREDAVHVLEACAQEDGLVPVLQERQLQRMLRLSGLAARGGHTFWACSWLGSH